MGCQWECLYTQHATSKQPGLHLSYFTNSYTMTLGVGFQDKTKSTPQLSQEWLKVGYLHHIVSCSGKTAFKDDSEPNKFVLLTKEHCHGHFLVLYKSF